MTDPTQDPRFTQDPYPTYAAMRSTCPVQPVPAGSGGRTSYLVTGYAEAREALGDARLSKDTAAFFAGKSTQRRLHPAVAHTMLASDPPQHTRLRKLVTKAFTTGAVTKLRPFIAQVTEELLDQWPVGEQFDFLAGLAVPLPVLVICELLGVPEGDRSDIQRWSAELFAAGRPDVVDAASHSMADYMTSLIAAKRLSPGTSLLDRLISARDGDDHLSEEELVSLAVLLLVAGHETTTNFLGNAVWRCFSTRHSCIVFGRIQTTSLLCSTSCFGSSPLSVQPHSASPPKRSGSAARTSRPVYRCWSLSEQPTGTRNGSPRRTFSTWSETPLPISASATASTAASALLSPRPRLRSPFG